MTLPRFALFAFVGLVSLAAQPVLADLRYGPTYDPANRIEDLAVALKNEFRSDFRATRFDGALIGTASAIEGNAQAILRLARSGSNQSQAILSIAGQIRRLAVQGQQQLSQVDADMVRGRGFVAGSPVPARQMLSEIDRLAAYVTQVAVLPPQAFGGGNQTYRPNYTYRQQYGSPYGQQYGVQYGSQYGSQYSNQFGSQQSRTTTQYYGPIYDDRIGQWGMQFGR